jgi:hypothetical protein
MDHGNHYETAFAALLRQRRICCLAVDETRRSWGAAAPLKSLDFIVHCRGGRRWLIDVKGRRFPGGRPERPRYVYENWATQDDVASARAWAERFGPEAEALFVFAYALTTEEEPPTALGTRWDWRDGRYFLRAVRVADYEEHLVPRSPRWGTVHLPGPVFQRLAQPLHFFLPELAPAQAG